jgi:hypothetical protein
MQVVPTQGAQTMLVKVHTGQFNKTHTLIQIGVRRTRDDIDLQALLNQRL